MLKSTPKRNPEVTFGPSQCCQALVDQMSPVENFYPTEQEAQQLAALVPRNPKNAFPVDDFLRQFVTFCQREDVRNFLFNPEPFQLTYLSNPQIAKSAVSGLLTQTRVENNTTRYFSDHLRSLFFMLPVFSSESINFGFGVHEHVYNPAFLWNTLNPGIFGRSMSRFVRDDSLGIMVVVLDCPDMEAVQVDYTQLVNTTGQIHSIARFRRKELQAIYASGIFDLQSLTTALESFQASYQVRDCPICGTKQARCNCELPRATPKHPFDISAFYTNMERRLGTYQGLAGVNLYRNGEQVYGTSVGSRCTIVGGIDVKLIERLQSWAICDSALTNDPRHSLIQLDGMNNVTGVFPNPLDFSGQPGMQDDVPLLDPIEDWYEKPMDAQPPVITEVMEDSASDQPQNMQDPSLLQNEIQQRDFIMTDTTDVSDGAAPAEQLESTPQGRSSSSGSQNISTTPSKSDSDDREMVKKLRAELRKERNRASAQRSNLRKKAEHDAKKLEIKTNKEKASLLRAKEMMLRQENMRLRQQIAEMSVAKQ